MNCGYCGHSCGNGACSMGLCPVTTILQDSMVTMPMTSLVAPVRLVVSSDLKQLWVVDSGKAPSSGQLYALDLTVALPSVTHVDMNLDSPADVTLDALNAYVAIHGSMKGALLPYSRSTFSAGMKVNNLPQLNDDAVAGTYVWVTTPTSVMTAEPNTSSSIASGNPRHLRALPLSPNTLYWLEDDPNMSGARRLVSHDNTANGAASPLATGLYQDADLAIVGGVAYVALPTLFSPTQPGEILAIPLTPDAGAPSKIADAKNPAGVISDGQNVYFTDTGAAAGVYRCPASGCDGAPPALIAQALAPACIAIDASYVYFCDLSGAADGKAAVKRVPR